MKYTDRKKTPLKWHRTVSFVIQPLLILGLAWLLLCMVNELFSLHLDFAWPIFTPLVQSVNPSLNMHNLGGMFWPVTAIFFVTVVLLLLSIGVWIGLLRWRNSARVLWLVFLLVETASLTAGVILISTKSDVLHALRMFAAFDSMSRSLLHVIYALAIMICLWNLIFLILNFIYYRKRKLLFQPDYIQPEKGSAAVEEATHVNHAETSRLEPSSASVPPENAEPDHSQPEPEAQAGETSVTETLDLKKDDENPTEVKKIAEKENSADTGISRSSVENTDAPKKEDQETGHDDNHRFCPYCGAKLGRYDVSYCSHCGRKLV